MTRIEDPHFLTGNGMFLDDLQRPEMVHACMLRAEYGHDGIEMPAAPEQIWRALATT